MGRSAISGTTVTKFSISETDHLQDIIDEASYPLIDQEPTGHAYVDNQRRFRGGAEIHLQKGTYDCDVTIHHPGVTILGDGANQTEITGKVTVYAAFTQIYNLGIRGDGKPYALRVMRNPAALTPAGYPYQNISRCRFENLICGAYYWHDGFNLGIDGPTNGIEIDGVYLTDFKHVVSSFCNEDGWLIDSTNALYPSTTLGFTDCSAVSNGRHGYNFQGSNTGIHILRGNVEQNGKRYNLDIGGPTIANEVRIESSNLFHLDQVDFESNQPLNDCIFVGAGGNGLVECCNFTNMRGNPAGSQPGPLRVIGGSTTHDVTFRNNRVENYPAGRIAQFDERGSGNQFYNNNLLGPQAAHAVQHAKVFSTSHPIRMDF